MLIVSREYLLIILKRDVYSKEFKMNYIIPSQLDL